jgi:hypothetical protein
VARVDQSRRGEDHEQLLKGGNPVTLALPAAIRDRKREKDEEEES